ncbi:MAG TPA: Stp1/IreP family PP2C-type Ser/Thr phosphatase [Ktedonobacterales bacterium]|nr:Stp1/IreP family PP2C-type Ser/Thr phosphatase [Ktedonobacterales bacterium]
MVSLPPGREYALSERLYRLLLLAYPRGFREEYAAEMLLVFRDAYCEASRRQGMQGVLSLWSDVLVDFVKTVCIQRVNSWIQPDWRNFALAGKGQMAMTLPFKLDIAQRTDVGRRRANNEDNLIAVVPEDQQLLQGKGALFVVADGMGGHERGEVASELTIQQVKDAYYHDLQGDIPTALRNAIQQANTAVCQANETERAQGANGYGMGATCVAAVLHEQMLYAANVGDSRAYVLHDGRLRQVTRDHSVVAQLVERGEITPAEVRTHEKRNQIYRALGEPDVEVDLFTEPVQEGDTLILCTDGLWEVLEDEELRAIIEQDDPEESVQRLIARANEAGGPDNVTAIVVRVSAA